MGEIIFNIIWWALAVWCCVVPNGYGPYVMLGFNIGDIAATFYFFFERGYLVEEDDLDFSQFLLSTLGLVLLGGFYIGGLSFTPGSDAYGIAVYLVFVTILMTFLYRFLQYNIAQFE